MKTKVVNGIKVEVITSEEWDVVSWEQKEKNARKHNRSTHGIDPCHLCGQTISNKSIPTAWFVHMSTSSELYPVAVELTKAHKATFQSVLLVRKESQKNTKQKWKECFK
jgi:hypothetical protein